MRADPPITAREQARLRDDFLEALRDYIDARIYYAQGDPEWRSESDSRDACTRLEVALQKVLEHDTAM